MAKKLTSTVQFYFSKVLPPIKLALIEEYAKNLDENVEIVSYKLDENGVEHE